MANAIPAARSLALRALPIGLAHNVRLKRPVARDTVVSYDDVELVNDLDALVKQWKEKGVEMKIKS